MTNPQSFNRYAYVQNNPVSFTDPSGLNKSSPGTTYGGSGILWSLWYGNNTDGYRLVFQWFEPSGDANSDLADFLGKNSECAKLLSSIVPTKWVSGDQVGGVFDSFSFVDIREHPGILDKTLHELGDRESTDVTLGDVLKAAYAYTVIDTGTIYLNNSHFSSSQAERGATLVHEILHAALGISNHVDLAAKLGISYNSPERPKSTLSSSATPLQRLMERQQYKQLIEGAASGAIDDWIRRGCK